MMRLQAGGQGYVPGVSGDIWYGGLKGRLSEAGDVIREGAGDVRDYMSQRGLSSMVGGVGGQFAGKQLGKWLLKKGIFGAMKGVNPLLGFGLEAGLGALGAYAGTRGAGSKGFLSFLGKDAPTIKKTKTGLLSGDIDYLEEMKGDIGEDIKGRATGSAITSLLSSLTSEAAGQAWGKYKGQKDVLKTFSGWSQDDIWKAYDAGQIDDETFDVLLSTGKWGDIMPDVSKQAGGSVYENPVSYQTGGEAEETGEYPTREKPGRYKDPIHRYLSDMILAGKSDEMGQLLNDDYYKPLVEQELKFMQLQNLVQSAKESLPSYTGKKEGFDIGDIFGEQSWLKRRGQKKSIRNVSDILSETLLGQRRNEIFEKGWYGFGSEDMPEYQMGGSTYQQSPSYQLNGLLKYKRNPIVG